MEVASQATAGNSHGSEDPVCWICLGDDGELERVCKCPTMVAHKKCLARWQLQSAGKSEETSCRFCHAVYPDWRASLTPPNLKLTAPVMAIKFEGRTYKLRVQPGPEGLKEFKAQVRDLLGFDITDEFDVCFEASLGGEKIKLVGLNSYGAATHCAAITASEREHKPHHTSSSRGQLRSTSVTAPTTPAPFLPRLPTASSPTSSRPLSPSPPAQASSPQLSEQRPSTSPSMPSSRSPRSAVLQQLHAFESQQPSSRAVALERQRSHSVHDMHTITGLSSSQAPIQPAAAHQLIASPRLSMPSVHLQGAQQQPRHKPEALCPGMTSSGTSTSTGTEAYSSPRGRHSKSGEAKLPLLSKLPLIAKRTVGRLFAALS